MSDTKFFIYRSIRIYDRCPAPINRTLCILVTSDMNRHLIVIGSLELSQHHTIRLSPKSTHLVPIVISEKMETHIIGNPKTGRTFTGWGDFKSLRGRTRGILIEGIECPVKVKSFFFRINHNDWNSVAFRLNFIKVENGKEDESLLQKNIIFHHHSTPGA